MNTVPITFDPRCNEIEPGGEVQYKNGFLFHDGLAAGASHWLRNEAGEVTHLRYMCPSGCGHVGCLPVVPAAKSGWAFDGNLEQPTLTPSIQMLGPCRWHGYLTKGVFTPC